MAIKRVFSSTEMLRQWLERRNLESDSGEAFNAWLQRSFEEGNEISVHDELYDYWACRELV